MNRVIEVGRLSRDPETRQAGETMVCNFGIAVDRRFKRDGESTADFFNCTAFGRNAEFISKYFAKGKRIGIVGRLQSGSYTNKDGVKVNTVDIVVDEAEFVDNKSDSPASGTAAQTAPPPTVQNANAYVPPMPNPAVAPQAQPMPQYQQPVQQYQQPMQQPQYQQMPGGYVPPAPSSFVNVPVGIDEDVPFR